MSELIQNNDNRATIHWKLLTGASVFALAISSAGISRADDSGQPQLWVTLGGDLSQLTIPEEKFAPPFILATPRPAPETVSPLSVGHPPPSAFGEDAKISFEPENSDWVFSAAIRYGRSSASKGIHQQSYPTKGIFPITPQLTSGLATYPRKVLQFIDVHKRISESHAVLDFQAGKDVGLGMFGAGSTSTFNLGVRFAQFDSKSNTAFKSDPDAHPTYFTFYIFKVHNGAAYHFNTATATTRRSFHGMGPSLSWNASVPAAGNPADGEIAIDWGVNAALLFGRQRAKVHHQTTAQYHQGKYPAGGIGTSGAVFRTTLYRHTPPDQNRSRSVTVPNIGGSVGLSYHYSNAKLSLGYRADFFFGAMDGGIDTRKSENRGFYGPYASISVGIGD